MAETVEFKKLLLENKGLAKKIREEAYNLILEEYKEYNWNKVIEKYLKLYNDILRY
jgi:glycosyltransferase involved in cell wall biosynthesis